MYMNVYFDLSDETQTTQTNLIKGLLFDDVARSKTTQYMVIMSGLEHLQISIIWLVAQVSIGS